MKRAKFIILTLVIITLGLSVIRVYISNQISTSGVALSSLEEKVDYYKTQNVLLSEKVYSDSSLTNIALKASTKGFISDSKEFVLNGQLPIAVKQ